MIYYCIFVYIIFLLYILLRYRVLHSYKKHTKNIQTLYKMKAHTKEIDAILWLTANMPMDKTFNLNKSQQLIIQDIFCLSGIGLPTEPTEHWDFYFDIADDWSTIKKTTI